MTWLLAVVFGMAVIAQYSNTPGRAETIPAKWPAASQIRPDASRPTLVMFAHPHCPCSRASVGELAQLLSDCQGQVSAQVWFIKPIGTMEDWTNTDLWRSASAIPGVTVHCDTDELEARRFNAGTSGQTVLYDQTGHLLFQGGITIARGHAGDNPGRSALEALLEHKQPEQVRTEVFGCSLFDSQSQQGEGGITCKR